MSLPVSLQHVIDEMDMQNDMMHAYISPETGETFMFTDEDDVLSMRIESNGVEEVKKELPDWQQERLPYIEKILKGEEFINLPSQFDIHEYSIMKDFCYTVEGEEVKEDLLRGIDGRGAFRMFKDLILRHGIRDDWFAFKNQALKKIAVRFLEHHEIPYEDDSSSNSRA